MIKQCACGQTFDAIPSDARFSPDPWLGGYYWDCPCGSTQFVKSPAPPSPRSVTEPSVDAAPLQGGGSTCDCEDCTESGDPCHCDCDVENACAGCADAFGAAEDARWDWASSIGMLSLLVLSLTACAPLRASEGVRVVYTPANDGTPCYTAYEGQDVRGFSCVSSGDR